jgi:hypothetical protein
MQAHDFARLAPDGHPDLSAAATNGNSNSWCPVIANPLEISPAFFPVVAVGRFTTF